MIEKRSVVGRRGEIVGMGKVEVKKARDGSVKKSKADEEKETSEKRRLLAGNVSLKQGWYVNQGNNKQVDLRVQ